MASVCFGEKKKTISYFLVWTPAPFPGLNPGRCCCCAVGAQLYLTPALLGLSALLGVSVYSSACGTGQTLNQRCATLERRHRRTAKEIYS